jgi:hypothetical protein
METFFRLINSHIEERPRGHVLSFRGAYVLQYLFVASPHSAAVGSREAC